MTLFVIAFVSGMLTVFAPCVLPVLPVILGVTALNHRPYTPYVVIGSLSFSIIAFSIFVKTTTLFIVIPAHVWMYISGTIFMLFGLTLLLPSFWGSIPLVARIENFFTRLLEKGRRNDSFLGYVLIGVALGPIFSTCSPTYFAILGTILPVNFSLGVFYMSVYTLGLAFMLVLIAKIGSRYMPVLIKIADPKGMYKRVLGILFILLGIGIALGIMAQFEIWLLDNLPFDITRVEYALLTRFFYE